MAVTCDATGRVLSRHTGYDASITRAVLQACAQACNARANECGQHADMHETVPRLRRVVLWLRGRVQSAAGRHRLTEPSTPRADRSPREPE